MRKLLLVLGVLAVGLAAAAAAIYWQRANARDAAPGPHHAIRAARGASRRHGARGARRARHPRSPRRPARRRAAAARARLRRRSRPAATRFRRARVREDILRQLAEGRVVLEALTVIEGWTFADMRRAVEAHPQIKVTLRGKDIAGVMSAIGHRRRTSGRALLPGHLSLRGRHHRSRIVCAGVSQDGGGARGRLERARRGTAAIDSPTRP